MYFFMITHPLHDHTQSTQTPSIFYIWKYKLNVSGISISIWLNSCWFLTTQIRISFKSTLPNRVTYKSFARWNGLDNSKRQGPILFPESLQYKVDLISLFHRLPISVIDQILIIVSNHGLLIKSLWCQLPGWQTAITWRVALSAPRFDKSTRYHAVNN